MRTGRALAGNPGTRACRLGKPTQCVDSLELFDGVNPCAKWLAYLTYLAYLGDSACGLTLKLGQRFKSARARPGTPYWSWSSFLNFKVKRAVSYVNDFKVAAACEARKRGVRDVVCGHIRYAEARDLDGVRHCIGGDGVERLPVLIEHAALKPGRPKKAE